MNPEYVPLLVLGGAGLLSVIGLYLFGVIEGGRLDRLAEARRRQRKGEAPGR
jgi:hypothetical protein